MSHCGESFQVVLVQMTGRPLEDWESPWFDGAVDGRSGLRGAPIAGIALIQTLAACEPRRRTPTSTLYDRKIDLILRSGRRKAAVPPEVIELP